MVTMKMVGVFAPEAKGATAGSVVAAGAAEGLIMIISSSKGRAEQVVSAVAVAVAVAMMRDVISLPEAMAEMVASAVAAAAAATPGMIGSTLI